MNVPVNVNGVTVEIPIDDAIIEEAIEAKKKKEKKTGYERNYGGQYYYQTADGDIGSVNDTSHPADNRRYQTGNYYTFKKVAGNNARADALMRNLRQFAAENGGCGKPNIASCAPTKGFDWYIIYKNGNIHSKCGFPGAGVICFKDNNIANAAIEVFRDELTWYFTEYDPMPEGWWGD